MQVSEVPIVSTILNARFHQRQVKVVRDSIAVGREIRRLVAGLAKKAAEVAISTGGLNLRAMDARLDALIVLVVAEIKDKLIEFGKQSFESAVEAFLKGLPRDLLTAIVVRGRQREAEEPPEITAGYELEGVPRTELEDAVRRLLFDMPAKDDIEKWLRTSLPGGKSWDERLKAWADKTRGAFLTEIVQGLSAGETPDQIERRLRPFADGLAYKSERIARTESCRVANRAHLAMCDELGDLIAGQQIFAMMDEWTRLHHAARHGRVYWRQPDGTYRDDQGNPLPDLPDEPNCRCMPVPALNIPEIVGEQPTVAANVYTELAKAKTPIGAGYEDWWKGATDAERMTAVGIHRYKTAQQVLGRAPEWIELIDTEGKLLSVDALKRETPEERAKRVETIKGEILKQELMHLGLTRTGGLLPAKLPWVTTIEQALKTIEARILGEKVEYAFVLDDDGTILMGKRGEKSQVIMKEEEYMRFTGKTVTHNHPGNGPPSPDDVKTLIAGNLKVVRAVTEKGVYELSHIPSRESREQLKDKARAAERELAQVLQNMRAAVKAKYEKYIDTLPTNTLNRRANDEFWSMWYEVLQRLVGNYGCSLRRVPL